DYYAWPNGSPYDFTLADLPEITEEQARALLEALMAMFTQLGLQDKAAKQQQPYEPGEACQAGNGDWLFERVRQDMHAGVRPWDLRATAGMRDGETWELCCYLQEVGIPDQEQAEALIYEWAELGDGVTDAFKEKVKEKLERAYADERADKFGSKRLTQR